MDVTRRDPPGPAAEPDEAVALRRLVAAYGRLSALVTGRVDLAAVTRLLAATVDAGVGVLGRTLDVLAVAGLDGGHDDVVERLRSHAGQRGLGPVLTALDRSRRALVLPGAVDPGSSVVLAPITAGDEVTAYLVTFRTTADGLTDDVHLLLTEHAAVICGVALGRERVVAAAAGRARLDLVEGVLHGRERVHGEIARWAGHLGFVEGREHHVLAASAHRAPAPGNGAASAVHATMESFLAHHASEAIVALRDDEVVAIVPGPRDAALRYVRDLAGRCRAAAERRHPGVVAEIGIGGPCAGSARIATSYSQARRSLETIRRRAVRGGVATFAELGVQRLLLQVPDVAELRAFAEEVLAGVLDQDAGTGSEHLRTLSIYFRENCSPRRAAGGLHVHPNTVSYRIKRIEELTGLRLDRYQDRLLAQVAVEILVPSEQP